MFADHDGDLAERLLDARRPAARTRRKRGEASSAAALAREYEVVALVLQGGGALGAYQAGVYEALHEGGIIVCLKADIDTILARTASHGTRPVLDSEDQGDRRQAIASLLAERRKLYEVAVFYVDTSTRTPREVVDEIIRQIKHEKIGGGSHA